MVELLRFIGMLTWNFVYCIEGSDTILRFILKNSLTAFSARYSKLIMELISETNVSAWFHLTQ